MTLRNILLLAAAGPWACTSATEFSDDLVGGGGESEAEPSMPEDDPVDPPDEEEKPPILDPGGFPVDFRADVEGGGEGVLVDPMGHLVLDPEESLRIFPYIWIANSGEHTVSKLDTETGQEVGRYYSGPGGADPSRTSVGLNGDVVVGNRSGHGATRIHADRDTCPDRNGNGVTDTSTGRDNVYPWDADGDGVPDDECILWYTPMPDAVRAVAFDYSVGADGELSSHVWIGGWDRRVLYELDASNGTIVREISIPANPYGMAFDGEGNIWVQGAGTLVQVNTETGAVTNHGGIPCYYGITVDGEGRPITAGLNSPCLSRFDPATGIWQQAGLPAVARGVAVDREGVIWVAGHNGGGVGAFRVDPDTFTVTNTIALGTAPNVGAAVDQAGKVWIVSQGGSSAHRIDPETLAVDSFPVGQSPYTYSDMTGAQLENAAPPLGRLTSILEGCEQKQQWWRLEWDADTPGGTWVRFRGRVAAARAGLGNAPWTILAEQPDDTSPVDLIPILDAPGASGSFGGVMQLEISMGAVQPGVTPRVRDVRVRTTCGGDLR